VRDFPVSPLRGWSDGMFHFLSALVLSALVLSALAVPTQIRASQKPYGHVPECAGRIIFSRAAFPRITI
jgi:hypothetical protein